MKSGAAESSRNRGRPRSFDREEAVERAMLIFWRQGYEGTSLTQLTEAMGINPPSLYAAFGDKQRLFQEVLDRYQDRAGICVGRALSDEPTARAGIHRMLRDAAIGLTRPDCPKGCMVVAAQSSTAPDPLREDLVRRRNESQAAIQKRLEQAIAEGELSAETDAAALAAFFSTVFQGMTIQARDGAGPERLLAVADAAMRAWPEPRNAD
jgi:AcrR family transcriptional regulator